MEAVETVETVEAVETVEGPTDVTESHQPFISGARAGQARPWAPRKSLTKIAAYRTDVTDNLLSRGEGASRARPLRTRAKA